jgi:GNAT superfamily N-acetyltransferase
MRLIKADEQQIEQILPLLAILFNQEAEFDFDAALSRQALLEIMANEDVGAILVAELDGKLVGMLTLLYTVSTALGGRVAILEDMVVAEQVRDKGVGQKLIAFAKQVALEKQCKRISLLTDADNTAAQRFYLRNGFFSSGMRVYRFLFPGAD